MTELYPIKTQHYPGRTTRPQKYFSHYPKGDKPSSQEVCATYHRSLTTAYNCRQKPTDSEEITVSYRNSWDIFKRARPVTRDELTVNGLTTPTGSNYALVANLLVRTLPKYEKGLKRRRTQRAWQADHAARELYLLVRDALSAHHFLTSPPPPGFTENEFVALLPLDLVADYQRELNLIMEDSKRYAEVFNQSHDLNPGNGAVRDLLNYSLEPYRPHREPEFDKLTRTEPADQTTD